MKRRLPLGFHDLEEELDDEELEDEDGNPKYKLGYVPPKTREMHKQVIRDHTSNPRILSKLRVLY